MISIFYCKIFVPVTSFLDIFYSKQNKIKESLLGLIQHLSPDCSSIFPHTKGPVIR